MSTSGLKEDDGSNMVKDFKMVVDEGFAKCEERLDILEADFKEIKTLLQKLLAKRASSVEARPTTQDSPAKLSQSDAQDDITKIYRGSSHGNPLQQPQQQGQSGKASPFLEETNEIIKSYENNELHKYLSEQFKKREPKAFSKNSSPVREGNPDNVLIKDLEMFLTRSNDPDKKFEALKNANPPKLICGKQRIGDGEYYTCIDCAQHTSCVLCSECFHNSIHRQHKHEVCGPGGGYCVCGDLECWRDGHACDLHKKPDLSHERVDDPQNILEFEMKRRAKRLFEAVMSFSHEALTLSEDKSTSAPVDSVPGDSSFYCTMISNSELLTPDQVLDILIKILTDCTHEKADAIIAELKENGKACIYKGEKRECEKIAKLAVEESTKIKSPGMDVEVMSYKAVAEQEIAHELLQWMKKIINISDGLTSILYRIMVRPSSSGGPLSLLERFLLDDTKISSASRRACHELYIDAVIRNKERHGEFAGIFTKHYPALVSSFLKAKHHITADSSVTNLTYQLYAPSSVVKKLVLNHKVLEVILNTILEESKAWQDNGTLLFKDPQDIKDYGLLLRSFHDLKNILSWCLVSFEWKDESRSAVLNGLDLFLKFMSLVQEMDLSKLPSRERKDLEAMQAPFIIQRHLKECSNLFVKLCSCDGEVHRRSYSMVLDRLSNTTLGPTTISIRGHNAECYSFDDHNDYKKTKIFLPIHRLFAALYIDLPDDIVYTSKCFAPLNQKIKLSDVIEYPLRVIVRLAQVESEVWNKKKYFVKQILKYKSREYNGGMLDRDIQILQIAASLMEPNELMIHILNKFNLTWLLTDPTHPSSDYGKKHLKYLIEKFLLLVISVIGERFVEGIGCVEQETVLKREIVHTLAIRDRSFSDLKKKFSVQFYKATDFEQSLKTVARVGENNVGEVMCKLRKEYYGWFNPCFHHYYNLKQSEAKAAQRKTRKDNGLSSVLSIPKPPTLCKKFTSIVALLRCDLMLQIMSSVVSDVYQEKPKVYSDCHLEQVLHLMTIGFHDDKSLYETGDKRLPFTLALQETKAGKEEKPIMDLLQQCINKKTSVKKSIKDLCKHVLGSWRELLELQNSCTTQ